MQHAGIGLHRGVAPTCFGELRPTAGLRCSRLGFWNSGNFCGASVATCGGFFAGRERWSTLPVPPKKKADLPCLGEPLHRLIVRTSNDLCTLTPVFRTITFG